MKWWFLALLCFGIVFSYSASAPAEPVDSQIWQDQVRARDDRIADLEQKMEVLADELANVRTQVAVPEEKSLKSIYGFGPAASKIYGLERGLSIGGYGEGYYTNFIGDSRSATTSVGGIPVAGQALDRSDFLRLVMYLGYKFTDKIIFNSEIEFEHATTEGTASAGGGSVSVEFASLDFLFRPELNARVGLLLLPMGFLNEIHEPPFFHGVQRPETELRILPSTWRENGAGIFGKLTETLEYRAYVVTGFNARGFSAAGIRGGRQQGDRAFAEDIAFVGRLDWTPLPEWLFGGSLYIGDSGQDQTLGGVSIPDTGVVMGELHGQYRKGPFEARALLALSKLSDARALTLALDLPATAPIAERMLGGYVEVAYDIWSMLFGGDNYLAPFIRVEYVDTQAEVPSGFSELGLNQYWVFTPGLTFKPHPNVVLKVEYRNFAPRAGEKPDELSFGMGFAF